MSKKNGNVNDIVIPAVLFPLIVKMSQNEKGFFLERLLEDNDFGWRDIQHSKRSESYPVAEALFDAIKISEQQKGE